VKRREFITLAGGAARVAARGARAAGGNAGGRVPPEPTAAAISLSPLRVVTPFRRSTPGAITLWLAG
jgi:hypothetical protein